MSHMSVFSLYIEPLHPLRIKCLSCAQAYNQPPVAEESFQEKFGDGVAWGGCTIVYLLGQELRFKLLDFTYHVLSVAETDTLPSSLSYIESMAKGTTAYSIVCTC